jgi:hypothetical protein
MEPAIKPLDKILFYKYLDKATHYMEFGSGGSTYQASIRPNIKSITVVESDLVWINKLQSIITHPFIQFNYIDIQAVKNNWGHPGKSCSLEDMKKYSHIKLRPDTDLVLIDGRFRVARCLKLFEQLGESSVIAFDDFLNRKYYHVVLDYYKIIEQTTDNIMVVLQKKQCVAPSDELIAKYEIIPK